MAKIIGICGDWHGDTPYAEAAIEALVQAGVDHIVHLGDFGFWPRSLPEEGPYFLMRVEVLLADAGIPLWWIDGNHEDFDVLERLPLDSNGRRPVSHHITHIPRGHRWTWEDTTWMGFGGAASVDRSTRTFGKSWFPQEYVTPEDVAVATDGGPVDIIVSHDAPFSVPFIRSRLAKGTGWPQEDILLSTKNQMLVDDVVASTRPSRLFHGHHHVAYTDVMPGGTEVQGLDCNAWDFYGEIAGLSQNIAIVNTDGTRNFG